MYLAYFDESGDSGFNNSPTGTFTLSAVLVHDSNWLSALDQSIAFRRYLKSQFRISPRDEIKASWVVHNKGKIHHAGLTYGARMNLYRAAMRFQRKSGVFEVFAIVIVKDRIRKRDQDIRNIAWQYAIQRLERFGASKKDNIILAPDEGHGDLIRKKIRAMRRFNFVPSAFDEGNSLRRNAENIIEDPFEKRSNESYFVQFADLNAYAAFRRVFPGKSFRIDVWDELGGAVIADVNRLSGGPPGIVVWPPA